MGNFMAKEPLNRLDLGNKILSQGFPSSTFHSILVTYFYFSVAATKIWLCYPTCIGLHLRTWSPVCWAACSHISGAPSAQLILVWELWFLAFFPQIDPLTAGRAWIVTVDGTLINPHSTFVVCRRSWKQKCVLDAAEAVLQKRSKQAVRSYPWLCCLCHPLGDKLCLLW